MLGYPRIGAREELKSATEAFLAMASRPGPSLTETAAALRRQAWETLRDAGLTGIPSNTFSLYDQVLDAAVTVNAVPGRFAGLDGLDAYFAMASGAAGIAPLKLAKWFDTDHRYLVPELGPDTDLRLVEASSRSLSTCRPAPTASRRGRSCSGRCRSCCCPSLPSRASSR